MVQPKIGAFSCSTGFGNPSGHSFASGMIFLIFLDMFHGSPLRKNREGLPNTWFIPNILYYMVLLMAFFWATTIPFSRYVLGVHSLNQILYGSLIGVWSACFLHFLVRDNLIRFVQKVRIKTEQPDAMVDENIHTEYHLKLSNIELLEFTQNDLKRQPNFSAKKAVIGLLIFYVLFVIATCVAFYIVDGKL
jgi:hypothetical protein